MPHQPAGRRIEPPVSVPSASGAAPHATAAADPPLEPPVIRSGSRGLRVSGSPSAPAIDMPHANSCVVVLPITIAPAARARGARTPRRRPGRGPAKIADPRGGLDALGVDQVLDGERDAAQRAGRLAARPGGLGRARLARARAPGTAPGTRRARVDPRLARLQRLDRRELARREGREQLAGVVRSRKGQQAAVEGLRAVGELQAARTPPKAAGVGELPWPGRRRRWRRAAARWRRVDRAPNALPLPSKKPDPESPGMPGVSV